MKIYRVIIPLFALILLAACSANKAAQQTEVQKTPMELASDSSLEAEAAYAASDYQGAIDKFNTAINYYSQAEGTASPADSIPQRIFNLTKNIAHVHSAYGYALSQQQLNHEALTEYESSIRIYQEIKPKSNSGDSIDFKIGDLYRNAAVASRLDGDFQKAIDYYNKYLEIHPEDDNVLIQEFYIYKDDLKDENQAFSVLKEYAISKKDFNASHRLGDLYRDKSDWVNAAIWYERADSIEANANVLRKLSNVYRNSAMQRWADSNRVMEKLLTISTLPADFKDAYKTIGDNYNKLKNKPKATEYFEKYLAMEYDESMSLYVCSYYFGINKYQKAVTWATTILDQNNQNPDARYMRAVSRYSLKDMKGAKADFQLLVNDAKYGSYAQQYLKSM